LASQQDVNGFLVDYPECSNESSGITIFGEDIQNLEGLLGIRKMGSFRILNAPLLNSLAGLDSLRFAGSLNIRYSQSKLQDLSALSELDSVGLLSLSFNEFITDLSSFQNLEFLNKLSVEGNGVLSGMNPVINNDKILESSSIVITDNHEANDLAHLLHPNIENIDGIAILESSNFSFVGLTQLDTIQEFVINDCHDISFEGLQEWEHIQELLLEFNDFSTFNPNHKLLGIDKIGKLQFTGNSNLESLEVYLPNLTMLSEFLFIGNNENLINITPLEDTEPPTEGVLSTSNRLMVSDNPDLISCESYLLCKAIELYPDSVRIEGNGEFCEKDLLTEEFCKQILSTDDLLDVGVEIYPNPFNHFIEIRTESSFYYQLRLYDVLGRELLSSFNSTRLYLDDLLSSTYFLKIVDLENGKHKTFKIVKE
jgi:hypothetical protein